MDMCSHKKSGWKMAKKEFGNCHFKRGKIFLLRQESRPGHFHCLPLFTVDDSDRNWKCPGLDRNSFFVKIPRPRHFRFWQISTTVNLKCLILAKIHLQRKIAKQNFPPYHDRKKFLLRFWHLLLLHQTQYQKRIFTIVGIKS